MEEIAELLNFTHIIIPSFTTTISACAFEDCTNIIYVDIHNSVNKTIGKPEWLESEVITYYEKLGQRNRSPIWTREDMKEVDYRSFVKGFITGSITLIGIGGVIYCINKMK
jgi:hypothetical protein